MASSESTAIINLIHLATGRRLDPVIRDSEATLIVERTAFVPYPHLPAPRPATSMVTDPPLSLQAIVGVLSLAVVFGILIGVAVSAG